MKFGSVVFAVGRSQLAWILVGISDEAFQNQESIIFLAWNPQELPDLRGDERIVSKNDVPL